MYGVRYGSTAEEASVFATGENQDCLESGEEEFCTATEDNGDRWEEDEECPDEEGTD